MQDVSRHVKGLMLTSEERTLFDGFMSKVRDMGVSPEKAAEHVPGVSSRQLRRYMGGVIPTRLEDDTKLAMTNFMASSDGDGGAPVADPLDEWGLARARAIERLVDLLGKDQRVLELRAEAALNASVAARLEAEKAPNRSAEVSAGGREQEIVALAAAMIERARQAAGAPASPQGQAGPAAAAPESSRSEGSV